MSEMIRSSGEANNDTPAVGSRQAVWILLAVLAGVLGGFLSNRLFAIAPVPPAQAAPSGEIIVPADGLLFKTAEGKPVAKLIITPQGNVFSVFNAAGNRAVELSGFPMGGDVSVYGNNEGGASLSIFAATNGGQLTLMGGAKSAIRMFSDENGGILTVNEAGGYPVVTLGAEQHKGKIELLENGGPAGKTLWKAP